MAEPEALQIKRIMDELDRFTENDVIEISQVVFDELREGTPVETGHLKSNWIPSIGSFSAVPTGSPDNPTDSAQSAGETRLLSYRLEQGRVYITNAVEYAMLIISPVKIVTAINAAIAKARFFPRRR